MNNTKEELVINILIAESDYIEFSDLKSFLNSKVEIKNKAIHLREMYNNGEVNYYVDKVKITLTFKNSKETNFFLEMKAFSKYIEEGNAHYFHTVVKEIKEKCPSRFNVKSIRKTSKLKVKVEFITSVI